MKFFCDQCNAQYMIADEKVGPRGVKVKCKKCSHVIVVKSAEAQAAAPASTPGGDETRIHDGSAIQAALAADRLAREAVAKAPAAAEPAAAISLGDAMQTPDDATAQSDDNARGKGGKGADKVWFVAVGDTQLGPLDVAEVHARWSAEQLQEDSLAWRAGMPDWIALSDIPEFTGWATQRSTAPADKVEVAAKKSDALGLAPASGVAWKPSAASALSSLMQEELLAAAAPKPQAVVDKPAGMPDLGPVVKLGAGDLFGASPAEPAAPRHDAAGGGGAAWSVPAPRKSGLSPAVWALVGGSVLSALGLGVFVTRNRAPDVALVAQAPSAPAATNAPAQVMTSTPQPQPQPQAQPQPASGATAQGATAAPSAAAAAPSQAAAPEAKATAASAPKVAQAASAAEPETHAPAYVKKATAPHAPRAAQASAASAAPPVAVKASLGKEDIWGVVRQSASKVAPCIKNARSRNEIPAGKYTFVLDWTIRPDGAVVDAHLKGPPEAVSTSLAACFSSAMMTWRFPASQAGAPIANFPFGPVNVP